MRRRCYVKQLIWTMGLKNKNSLKVEFIRVEYDVEKAAQKF